MNEEAIFAQAIQIADARRRIAFLDQVCADNPSLRAGVEALLTSHAEARSFLEVPAIESTQPTIVTGTDDILATGGETQQPVADDLRFLRPSESDGVLGTLGHYEVLSEVGRGGLGVVLKARDTRLDRIVAIKVPASEYAAIAAVRQRFKREAMTAAAVSHDHVVTIHAVDEDRGIPYLVMEYIDGLSLQDAIDAGGPQELKEILRIGIQTARGLAAAHEQGLVHRDIKPANILLENGIQRVKITDFGLARSVDDVTMTQTGTVAGTPQYMSPEQAHANQVDHRSDLFSLGSVLYAMSTGRAAFRANSTMAVLKRVCEDSPKPIRQVNPEIPEWLCEIVEKLLEKRPEDRFQSAGEVADLLNRHLAHLQQPEANPQPARIASSSRQTDARTQRRLNTVRNILAILGALTAVWFVIVLLFGVVIYDFGMRSLFLSLVVAAVALNGAWHVAHRSSYAWAIAGCVALMLPVSLVSLMALPLALVALGTLARREVRAAFGIRPRRDSLHDDRTVVTDSTGGTTAGESTLIARCRRRYRNAHHRWGDAAIIVLLLIVVSVYSALKATSGPVAELMWRTFGTTGRLTLLTPGPDVDVTFNGRRVPVARDGSATMFVPPGDFEVVTEAGGETTSIMWLDIARGVQNSLNIAENTQAVHVDGPLSQSEKAGRFSRAAEAEFNSRRSGRLAALPGLGDDLHTVTRDGELVRIHIDDGTINTTVVRKLGAPYADVEGLAPGSDGLLYASVNFGASPAQLHRIDPRTGDAVFVGTMNHAEVDGLTFDASDVLLGVVSKFGGGERGQLIEIDTTTGASRAVSGDLGLEDLDSLAIDAKGRLLTTDGIGRGDAFYRLDRQGAGPATRLAPTPPVAADRDVEGLTLASDGYLYAVTNPLSAPVSHLLRIDPETFEYHNLGSLGFGAMSIVAVPQPAEAAAPTNAEVWSVLKDALLILNFSATTDNYAQDGARYIKDYSAHGHDAQLNETHTLDVAGRAGSGLRCTGGAGALLPERVIGNQSAFTLAGWVYRERDDRHDEIYSESSEGDDARDVRVRIVRIVTGLRWDFASGEVREVELPGGERVERGAWGKSGAAPEVQASRWTFLAWRFDPQAEDGKWWTTINGETTESTADWRPYTDGGLTKLGDGFEGVLDEFVAFPRALSDDELNVLYRAGLHGKSLRPLEVPVEFPPSVSRGI